MSKYKYKGVTINKPDALTHGKLGIIDHWDNDVRKYKISFDMGWCGWYKRKELIFDC